MRQYELVERVLKYDPTADEGLLNRAYVYAMKAHIHQKRASGAPYFTHPLEVAAILTDLKLDDATRIMEDKKIRRLPVIDTNKRMVGMLSLGDISHSAKSKLSGEVLHAVSAHHI